MKRFSMTHMSILAGASLLGALQICAAQGLVPAPGTRALSSSFVDLTYGLGVFHSQQVGGTFADLGMVDLKLGYSQVHQKARGILDIADRYALASYYDDRFPLHSPDSTAISGRMFRIGLGIRGGLAYAIGSMALYPYHQVNFSATKVSPDIPPGTAKGDAAFMERVGGAFRLGIATEAGLEFQITPLFSVHGGYEASIIYPRVVFPQWAVGYVITATGVYLSSMLATVITESVPPVGPMLMWLLRNGVAFGAYYLMSENMHWPFPSEAPLTHQSFTAGITFSF